MKVTLYIPFANGDAVNGFNYEGEELTAPKYVKMEENEIKENQNESKLLSRDYIDDQQWLGTNNTL